SGANEGRAVAHLLATRIAAEEAEWRAGSAEADDRLQRVLAELPVHGHIDPRGLGGQLAKRLTLGFGERHGFRDRLRRLAPPLRPGWHRRRPPGRCSRPRS